MAGCEPSLRFTDRARALAVWAFIDPLPHGALYWGLQRPSFLLGNYLLSRNSAFASRATLSLCSVSCSLQRASPIPRDSSTGPPIPRRAASWLRRLRGILGPTRVANATIVLPGLGVSASIANAPTVVVESPSVEARVTALEEKARQLDERIGSSERSALTFKRSVRNWTLSGRRETKLSRP